MDPLPSEGAAAMGTPYIKLVWASLWFLFSLYIQTDFALSLVSLWSLFGLSVVSLAAPAVPMAVPADPGAIASVLGQARCPKSPSWRATHWGPQQKEVT